MLAKLERRFTRFRSEHAGGTRIPEELRAGCLVAIEAGVAPGALYAACGVSWSQVDAWKTRAASQQPAPVAEAGARVFTVVDDPPAQSGGASPLVEQALELRVGPWSVSVRLADAVPGSGGDT